jgi:uncharacterized protein
MVRTSPFLILFCFFALLRTAQARLSIPELSQPVIDESHLLNTSEEERIDQVLRAFHEQAKFQMAIFIPASLQDLTIETFSISVAEKWKLGRKGEDRGLLLVIAPKERKVRLEVGYGLEGDLTDAFSYHIVHEVLPPYFKERRFGDGILIAIEEIAKKLNLEVPVEVPNRLQSEPEQQNTPRGDLVTLIFLLLFGGAFLWPYFFGMRRYGGGYWGGGGGWGGGGWGGGSSSGGNFGGGGGGFGGGGASSDW